MRVESENEKAETPKVVEPKTPQKNERDVPSEKIDAEPISSYSEENEKVEKKDDSEKIVPEEIKDDEAKAEKIEAEIIENELPSPPKEEKLPTPSEPAEVENGPVFLVPVGPKPPEGGESKKPSSPKPKIQIEEEDYVPPSPKAKEPPAKKPLSIPEEFVEESVPQTEKKEESREEKKEEKKAEKRYEIPEEFVSAEVVPKKENDVPKNETPKSNEILEEEFVPSSRSSQPSQSKNQTSPSENAPQSYSTASGLKGYIVQSKDLAKGWYIQIAVLEKLESLQSVVVHEAGKRPLALVPEERGGKTRYRVLVGPIAESERQDALKKIRAEGFSDSFLRKIGD